ncbi:hypothetical protein [Maribacter sp. ACAM166]|uniref:hypothetical protein n=1 Tax=Maribacter sp. ACAM166 TaxID=2508996 RepID=UPI0010FD70F6|nr:hypothetical protein [Maribacter sp. ACAM166]TLP81849.1 hypothetical protein ES765_03985 [Maribacter sp. ACAM166]
MISSEKLLKYLIELSAEENPEIGGQKYSQSDVLSAEQLVRDAHEALQLTLRKPKLSRRRAFIVILEELYFDVLKYPDDLKIESIHRRASQRFEYMNRDTKSFNTPSDIHPKDPCTFYEDNGYAKSRYKSALQHLVLESHRYFEVPEAEVSLKVIFEDVKLC